MEADEVAQPPTTPTHPAWNVLLRTCPSHTSMSRISNKWTAMVVITLTPGPQRFGEIAEKVDGISRKVLTDTLKDLERDGLIVRIPRDEYPRRVDYALTPLGETLIDPMAALARWAETHMDEVIERRAEYDARQAERVPAHDV